MSQAFRNRSLANNKRKPVQVMSPEYNSFVSKSKITIVQMLLNAEDP